MTCLSSARLAARGARAVLDRACSRKPSSTHRSRRPTTARSTVHLGKDHPGFNDPVYRARRNEIAAAALAWTPGEPVAADRLHRAEHEVWRTVCARARRQARALRGAASTRGQAALGLPEDRIPQLDEVTARLEPLTGFRYHPAPGSCRCASSTARSPTACSTRTQYVRHPAEPLYTPEPDIIHEVIGHGNMLASARASPRSSARPATPRAVSRPTRRCSSSPTSSGSRWSSA